MVLLFLLTWFALAGAAAAGNADQPCEHTRLDAVFCARKYGDLNKDGAISRAEIEALRATSLHWWENLLGWILHGESTDAIMRKCDANGDGLIDDKDFEDSRATCLRDCDSVSDFFHYVCDRQAERLVKQNDGA